MAERLKGVTTPRELEQLLADCAPRWFAIVADARSSAVQPAKARRDKMAHKTAEQYAKDAKRAERAGWDLAQVAHTRASFDKVRAASTLVLAERIRDILNAADEVERDARAKGATVSVARAKKLAFYDARRLDELLFKHRQVSATKWDEIKADAKGARASKEATAKRFGTRMPAKTTRQRQKLGRLPDDWRDRMWERMGRGKYAAAYAVAAVLGVRPAELEKGVRVVAKGNAIAVRVIGAKCKDVGEGERGRGQKYRDVVLSIDSVACKEAFRFLQGFATASAGGVVVTADARKFGHAFLAASKREFGEKVAPSAYALRHAFAADMKAAGEGGERLAMAMGHQTTRSQGHYGTFSQGHGGLEAMTNVRAATQVRGQPAKPPPPSKTAKATGRKGQWAKVNALRR